MVSVELTVLVERLDESLHVSFKQLRQFLVVLLVQLLAQLVPNVERDLRHFKVKVTDTQDETIEGFDGVVRGGGRASADHSRQKRLGDNGEYPTQHHRLVGVFMRHRVLISSFQLHNPHEDCLLELRRRFFQVNRFENGADAIGGDVKLLLGGASGIHEYLEGVSKDGGTCSLGQGNAIHLHPRRETGNCVELETLHSRAVGAHETALEKVEQHR